MGLLSGKTALVTGAARGIGKARQYSCEKTSCSAQKFLAAGHFSSFQMHPRAIVFCYNVKWYFLFII